MLSKRVEKTVGKEEIAHYEQFLLFPQCFQKACFPRASKGVIVWEWVSLTGVLKHSPSTVHGLYPVNVRISLQKTNAWQIQPVKQHTYITKDTR